VDSVIHRRDVSGGITGICEKNLVLFSTPFLVSPITCP
jgi:hypothetical protein